MGGDLTAFLSSLADRVIPGGCPTCPAEQLVRRTETGDWVLVIAHDESCPAYRARKKTAEDSQ